MFFSKLFLYPNYLCQLVFQLFQFLISLKPPVKFSIFVTSIIFWKLKHLHRFWISLVFKRIILKHYEERFICLFYCVVSFAPCPAREAFFLQMPHCAVLCALYSSTFSVCLCTVIRVKNFSTSIIKGYKKRNKKTPVEIWSSGIFKFPAILTPFSSFKIRKWNWMPFFSPWY